jgi:hypothetical protein
MDARLFYPQDGGQVPCSQQKLMHVDGLPSEMLPCIMISCLIRAHRHISQRWLDADRPASELLSVIETANFHPDLHQVNRRTSEAISSLGRLNAHLCGGGREHSVEVTGRARFRGQIVLDLLINERKGAFGEIGALHLFSQMSWLAVDLFRRGDLRYHLRIRVAVRPKKCSRGVLKFKPLQQGDVLRMVGPAVHGDGIDSLR